ncbi:hypothetical protein BY458DRAFT_527713 [Sporodiniella umbellata]|nr:hypothetical protein BY458DRAFT_527713 [Sporodiniella umbellata]
MDPEELNDMIKDMDESEDDDALMENSDEESEVEGQDSELEEEKSEGEEANGKEQSNIPQKEKNTSQRFRDSFMTKITQAFGNDLDQIRQEPTLNGPRLDVLIDSLEAGIDIFSTLEQDIILADEEKAQTL